MSIASLEGPPIESLPQDPEAERQAYLEAQQVGIEAAEARMDTAATTMERMDHKDSFYRQLGKVTMAAIDSGQNPERDVHEEVSRIERVRPRTVIERFMDKRTEKKLEKLAKERAKRDMRSGSLGQTYGVRPAWSQFRRLREASARYRDGEISARELEDEKLRIRATRSTASRVGGERTVAVRNIDQRRAARVTTRAVVGARVNADTRGGETEDTERRPLRRGREASPHPMDGPDSGQLVTPHWRAMRRERAIEAIKESHRQAEEHRRNLSEAEDAGEEYETEI